LLIYWKQLLSCSRFCLSQNLFLFCGGYLDVVNMFVVWFQMFEFYLYIHTTVYLFIYECIYVFQSATPYLMFFYKLFVEMIEHQYIPCLKHSVLRQVTEYFTTWRSWCVYVIAYQHGVLSSNLRIDNKENAVLIVIVLKGHNDNRAFLEIRFVLSANNAVYEKVWARWFPQFEWYFCNMSQFFMFK